MLGSIGVALLLTSDLSGPPKPPPARYMGDPVLPPAAVRAAPPRVRSAGHGVVFVNFDGAVLVAGPEDARENRTQMGFEGTFAPYGGDGSKREAVLQAVRTDWAAYDVDITDVRPADGEYTMAMVGPTNFTQGSLGIALLDCEDAWTHNNVVYAFHQASDNYSAAATATTIGQEVAHSFGLEHVDQSGDIMNPYNLGGDPAFLDQCSALIPADFGILCEAQHQRQCGSTSSQNSHAELLDLFGGEIPDTTPPSVRIESPQDGAVFEVGASFEIVAFADDDTDGDGLMVELLERGKRLAADGEAPYGWRIEDAPAGEYHFVAQVIDAAGNVSRSAETVVSVAVGGDPGLPDPDAGETEGGSGGEDARDPTGGIDPDDADFLPDDGPKPLRFRAIDEPGCSCRSAQAPGIPALSMLLLVLFVRRRRSCART